VSCVRNSHCSASRGGAGDIAVWNGAEWAFPHTRRVGRALACSTCACPDFCKTSPSRALTTATRSSSRRSQKPICWCSMIGDLLSSHPTTCATYSKSSKTVMPRARPSSPRRYRLRKARHARRSNLRRRHSRPPRAQHLQAQIKRRFHAEK
jgi:hypothetical protein